MEEWDAPSASQEPRSVGLIPLFKDFLKGFVFFANSRDEECVATAGDLADVLKEVARLAAGDESTEPAAFFFAVARRPEAMGEIWGPYPITLARNHAASMGLVLLAIDDELHDLRMAINLGGMSFEDVRDWFRARIRPAI